MTPCDAAATVMTVSGGPVVTTFNGGTFSAGISGVVPDGWYYLDPTTVTLFYGISGEYVRFTTPATFQSVQLRNRAGSGQADAWTLTFRDAGGSVLDAQALTLGSTYQTYDFNIPNVSSVTFTFASGGVDQYNIGQNSAWFDMTNATFTTEVSLPEPATAMVLLAGASGMACVRRRRRPA